MLVGQGVLSVSVPTHRRRRDEWGTRAFVQPPCAPGDEEVDDGGACEGVQGGGEVGHGGGENGGDEEAGYAVGHLLDDEGGKDVVVGLEVRGMAAVEDEEADADEQEKGELEEDDGSGAEQGQAGLAQVAGGEHALHHELVGAVRGHGQEGSAEKAGPEGVRLGEIEGEVEHVELGLLLAYGHDVWPMAGSLVADRPESDQGSGDVQGHLDDVGPDHGGHASLESVEEGQGADDADGENVSGANREADDDGDGEDADPFGGSAVEEEEASGELVQSMPEALIY